MKFIHIADMHFDTPFMLLNSKGDFGKIRRMDQREILKKIINYIKENNIEYLFIAGDFYEHNYIRQSTIEYINDLFKQIPKTKIFITPGNHDPYVVNSMYRNFTWNNNVKIFTSKIEKVETDEANIYGVGFEDFYCEKSDIENIILEDKSKINVLIAHGSLNASDKAQLQYNPINKSKLEKVGFDYVALGHIHKPDYNTENNQKIIYPGSTIAMGFDELGKHGFIVGSIEKDKLEIAFIPVDKREFKEIEVNITEINDEDELLEKINNIYLEEDNLYKIILIGERNFEININNLYKFINKENIIKIKNKTRLNYNLEKMVNDNTLKGIFINEIKEELTKNNYTKEKLDKILEIGLSILEN